MQSIITGIPTDRDGLARHMKALGFTSTTPIPPLTDKHVAVACLACSRECWIGENQAKMHTLMQTPVLCYFCVMTSVANGQPFDTVALDD